MEIHISRSAWFVVATTNNKRFKKINFDNFRFKLRLGLFCGWRRRQRSTKTRCKQGNWCYISHFTNVSPLNIIRHWVPHTCQNFSAGSYVLLPHLGAVTRPNAKNTATTNGVCASTDIDKYLKTKKKPPRQEKQFWTRMPVISGWTRPIPTQRSLK